MNKAIESLMGKLPDMDKLMPGYEFKDGKLKSVVNYWASDDKDIINPLGVVELRAKKSMLVPFNIVMDLPTQLSLDIKPKELMFVYFLTYPSLKSVGMNVIMPNIKEDVHFLVISTGGTINVPMDVQIGYGFFQPVTPINNISLTRQDATP